MISAVDNNIIWGMSGTTSGAYCQQWTTIRGATCICDENLATKEIFLVPGATIRRLIILRAVEVEDKTVLRGRFDG